MRRSKAGPDRAGSTNAGGEWELPAVTADRAGSPPSTISLAGPPETVSVFT